MRRRVKAMSYGLAYGLSAYGLASQLKIPPKRPRGRWTQYFARFGGVRDYLQGRRRAGPQGRLHLHGSAAAATCPNWTAATARCGGRRAAALNAPIQGSAADIIKMAMINVDTGIKAGSEVPDAAAGARRAAARNRRRRAGPPRRWSGRRWRRLPARRAAGGVGRLRPQLGTLRPM